MSTPKLVKVEAIVLKRKNFQETDRRITLFTKHKGKLEVIAKGVRKVSSRRAPHLEAFRHIKATIYKSRIYDTISEVTSVETPKDIVHLSRITHGYLLCELVDCLTPLEQPHKEVFDSLKDALDRVAETKDETKLSKIIDDFVRFLLKELGFATKTEQLDQGELINIVEKVTERKLRSQQLLTKLRQEL